MYIAHHVKFSQCLFMINSDDIDQFDIKVKITKKIRIKKISFFFLRILANFNICVARSKKFNLSSFGILSLPLVKK